MSALLGNFLAGDQVEPAISLSDDTILTVPFSELTRHAFHKCDLVFLSPQSKFKLCLRHRVIRQRSIEAGKFNIRRLISLTVLEARSTPDGCDPGRLKIVPDFLHSTTFR